MIDYILMDEEMIYYMKIEDAIDSNHPLVVSLKGDRRDRRRGKGREEKGKEHIGEFGMREVEKYLEGEWREGNMHDSLKEVEGRIREILGNIEMEKGKERKRKR